MLPRRPFKVLVFNYFPYANNECANFPRFVPHKNCYEPGLMTEVVNVVTKYLDWELLPVVVVNGEGNAQSTYTAIGKYPLFDNLYNKTYDTIAAPFQEADRLQDLMDYSTPMFYTQPNFYVYQPDEQSSWWRMFSVYDVEIWALIVALLVVQCLVVALVRHLERVCGVRSKGQTAAQAVWSLIQMQCFQPERAVAYKFASGNMSTAMFGLLQCLIVFGVFSSYLLSGTIQSNKNDGPMNFNRVLRELRNRRRNIISLRMTFLEEAIRTKNYYPFSHLRDQGLVRNVTVLKDEGFEEVVRQMREKNAILFAMEEEEVAQHVNAHCDITTVGVDWRRVSSHLLLRKNYSQTRTFSRAINANRQKLKAIYRKYTNRKRDRGLQCNRFKLGDALRIQSYIGLLILCSLLLVAGFVALLFERCYSSRVMARRMLSKEATTTS